jgi:transposase
MAPTPAPAVRREPRKNLPPDEPADHVLERSCAGFGTKIHPVSGGNGLPLAAEVTAGQRQECTQVEHILGQVGIPRRKGQRPEDGQVRFDQAVVAQRAGWLKGCQAVATRFDKLAVNYLATVKVTMIRRYPGC